jgi:hypothetical protein
LLTGIRMRTTSCRKRRRSTQCAYPYRESLHCSDPPASDERALEREDGWRAVSIDRKLALADC